MLVINVLYLPIYNEEQTKVRECMLLFGAEFLSSGLLPENIKIKIYRAIILPVVLYGCETWSLTLREERRLRCWWSIFRGLRGTR